MIKANELRIGNVAQVANLTGAVTDILSDPAIYMSFSPHYEYSDEHLEPIPLTPEILEKCGFELTSGEYFLKDKIAIKDKEPGYCLIEEETYGEYLLYIGKPFQYLHQLQNLFYCLCGEELKIEL